MSLSRGKVPFVTRGCPHITTLGITLPLGRLSRSPGQVTHALLPLSPLPPGLPPGFVRLACLIHAANVRSEPGSNPSWITPPRGCDPPPVPGPHRGSGGPPHEYSGRKV